MKKWIVCFSYTCGEESDTAKEWVESESKPSVEEAKRLVNHQDLEQIIYIKEM